MLDLAKEKLGALTIPMPLSNRKSDKEGYNEFYAEKVSPLTQECDSPDSYIESFKKSGLSPFSAGGTTKGYVRNLSVDKLLEASNLTGMQRDQITVLDAGCGLGELSTYLACKGFNVIGVDISAAACQAATHLSKQIGVSQKCTFLSESLEDLSVTNSSIDFIIGHASLHHFVKYEKVPKEFDRVMKNDAKGFFSDSFHENPFYQIFHNKERMERLGDVLLSKKLIDNYFDCFEVTLTATDWFVMLDKLYSKILPKKRESSIRQLSRIHFWLDRKIPCSNRVSLALSGSVVTTITKIS